MKPIRFAFGALALLCLAPAAATAQQHVTRERDRYARDRNPDDHYQTDRRQDSPGDRVNDQYRGGEYDRGFAAGYAAAMRQMRPRGASAVYARRGYVSEYTPYNPYASQNRPRTSMPARVSAGRVRTDVRGRFEEDEYLDYPGQADYHQRRDEDLPPRGRVYDPGDFRDEQGGIYGGRGVLLWTDRYDTGDYVNKFWNTHRDNVYAGQRVWNTYSGHQ